jgi:hypothetical protein
MNYDTCAKIDDARHEAEQAEEALGAAQDALVAVQDRLESLAYIFSEALKQAGYGPAKAITEKNCVEFFDGLLERHGVEDDVVEAIVEGLKPVDSEVPFEREPNVYERVFKELGVDLFGIAYREAP